METPLISICVSAYKAEEYLKEALASVGAQTYRHWELVVVEDGSKDRTEAIVREFENGVTQPVQYLRHEMNRGLPVARNTTLAAAKGEWIAFLDADDVWTPTHLESLLGAATRGAAHVAYAGAIWFDSASGREIKTHTPLPDQEQSLPVAMYTTEFAVLPSTVLVKYEMIKAAGEFSSFYPISNDLEYWLRISKKGAQFVYTGEITCRYRRHSNNLTAPSRDLELTVDLAEISAAYSDWDGLPMQLRRTRPPRLFYWAGRMALRQDPVRAKTLFRKSLRFNCVAPKALALLAVATWKSRKLNQHVR